MKRNKKGKQETVEQEQKNPLHKEYGLFKNMGFVFKHMIGYDKKLLLLIIMGAVCELSSKTDFRFDYGRRDANRTSLDDGSCNDFSACTDRIYYLLSLRNRLAIHRRTFIYDVDDEPQGHED